MQYFDNDIHRRKRLIRIQSNPCKSTPTTSRTYQIFVVNHSPLIPSCRSSLAWRQIVIYSPYAGIHVQSHPVIRVLSVQTPIDSHQASYGTKWYTESFEHQ